MREAKGLSIEELAKRAEMKPKRVEKIEAALILPFITELEAMANALDTKFWKIMEEAENRDERAKTSSKGK